MKKFISLTLCLVFFSTLFLVSCDEEIVGTSTDNTVSITSGDGKHVASIPEKDYGGKVITFLTCGPNAEHESEIIFNTYEDGGDETMAKVVNEAIAERNNEVEALLNVKIEEQYVFDGTRKNGAFANKIRLDAAAGLGDYQVIVPCIYDGATLAAEGLLYDLKKDIDYLDMSQPWWDQTFNEELTINDKLYFTVGDIGIVNKEATAVLFFNKNLITEYSLDNPYELVKDQKWTLDTVTEMAKKISSDDNQDGIINYNDSMGWSGQLDDMWHLFYGAGEKIASIGSDGYPILTMYSERSSNVIDDMLALVQDDEHYISANDYWDDAQWPSTLTIRPFLEGRCLFFSALISSSNNLADMDDDFGIVPVPTYEEGQDYHSLINPWVGNCFAIPANASVDEDKEFVGIVLEAMGASSKNILQPAFYDVALKYQNIRDDDSIEMLEMIFESRGCDLGIIFAWGKLDLKLQDLAAAAPGTFASTYESVKDTAQSELKATVDFFKENE